MSGKTAKRRTTRGRSEADQGEFMGFMLEGPVNGSTIDMKPVQTLVEEVVRRKGLSRLKIISVAVDPDTDWEGDPVFQVRIVIDGEPVEKNFSEMNALAVSISEALAQYGISYSAFLTFTSKDDADADAAEA